MKFEINIPDELGQKAIDVYNAEKKEVNTTFKKEVEGFIARELETAIICKHSADNPVTLSIEDKLKSLKEK